MDYPTYIEMLLSILSFFDIWSDIGIRDDSNLKPASPSFFTKDSEICEPCLMFRASKWLVFVDLEDTSPLRYRSPIL